MKIFSICFALCAAFCLTTAVAMAKSRIMIGVNDGNRSDKNCATAFVENRKLLAGALDAEVEILPITTFYDAEKIATPQSDQIFIRVTSQVSPADIAYLPFLFRDAAHFQQFLASELYQRMAKRMSGDRMATAYGGFYQLFSRRSAVTEAKHFREQYISGDVRGVSVYMAFKARFPVWYILSSLDANWTPAEDAARMGAGHPMVNMVEALLPSAFEHGLDKNARFVNLISSAVHVIEFDFRAGEVTDAIKRRLVTWADVAAKACSMRNYDEELDTLERLKQAGLEIVPFDRASLVEKSWTLALTEEHPNWIVSELDEIVKLGQGTGSIKLPSALLKKLSASQRLRALKFDKLTQEQLTPAKVEPEPEAEVKTPPADIPGQDRMKTAWLAERYEFATAVAKIEPPVLPNVTNVVPPREPTVDIVRLRKVVDFTRGLLKECNSCENSLQSWALLAQAYFLLGDSAAAVKALDNAFANSLARKKLSETEAIALTFELARSAAMLRDPRASAATAAYLNNAYVAPASPERYASVYYRNMRFSELLRASELLVDIGQLEKAVALIEEAARLAPRLSQHYLDHTDANLGLARWYAGDLKEGWKLIVAGFGVEEIGGFYYYGSSRPLDLIYLLRIEQLERFARKMREISPESHSSEYSWLPNLEKAMQLAIDYEQPDFVERNLLELRTAASVSTSLQFKESVNDMVGRLEWRRTLADPASPDYPKSAFPYANDPDRNMRLGALNGHVFAPLVGRIAFGIKPPAHR